YDLILDLAVYQSFAEFRQIFGCKRVLSPGGRYVSLIVGGLTVRIFRALFLKPWMSIAGSRKMDVQLGEPNRMEDLLFVKGLLESSKITPVIDRTYPLSEVPEALRHLQSGRAQGKIVIVV
ncbi:MAG: zinc-binding dehydrogenase, partial [Chloroflexi bacterium]|nr:zinc-binding dehydrogenase [Chloroflexota bacterium]